MNYAYIRVSTEEQNLENQKLAIKEKYKIRKWVYEKRSGTVDFRNRKLGELMKVLHKGDTLVVTELSRLGRSLRMISKIMNELTEKGVRIIAIKNNFDFNPTDKNDIISQVLIFAFGLSAQIERDLISERTKLGLEVARKNGKKIGRQKGEIVYNVKLRQYQRQIIRKFHKGQSINSLRKEYKVNWITMKNFIYIYSKMKNPHKKPDIK
jgi:DNA invertase Pin-like site-specific DNA recombinase